METVLTDRWLRGLVAEPTLDEASVALARELVIREARDAGFPEADAVALATVASELGHNQLRHARYGSLAVRPIARAGVRGLEIVAADGGAGIEDVGPIVASGPRDRGSLGIGLSGVLALADEVDFDVRLGEGSCVWARKFVAPVPRARSVALVGRPIEGEPRAGDDATFVRQDDGTLVLAVVDGLGHGREAREAAQAAVACVVAAPERSLDSLLVDAHAALARTRGAVMGLARLTVGGALEVALSGNVSVRTVGRKSSADRRYAGPSFALGMPGPAPRMRVDQDALAPYEALVAFSDGLSSRFAVDASLFAVPPIVAARKLLDEFSDGRDDALVALVR